MRKRLMCRQILRLGCFYSISRTQYTVNESPHDGERLRNFQLRSVYPPIAKNVSSPASPRPLRNLLLRHLSSQHRSTPDSQPAPPTPSIISHRALNPKSHITNRSPPQMHQTPHLRSRNPSPLRKLQGSNQLPPLNPRPRLFPHRPHR